VRSTYVFVLAMLAWMYVNHISLILTDSVAWRNESVCFLDSKTFMQ